MRDALSAAEALFFFLIARALGRLFLRIILRIKTLEKSPVSEVPAENFAYATGLGAAGLAIFLLGLAGFLFPVTLGTLCACVTLLAWLEHRNSKLSGRLSLFPSFSASRFPLWKTACIAVLLYSTWHVLISAFASPTEWDVLVYHLALPKLYWAQGRIQEIPWLMDSHFPHLMAALYVLPLSIGQDNLAALLHASACAALAFSIFSTAKRQWGEAGGWSAAALFAAQPIVLRYSGTAHSDGGFALFYFLASLAAWNWTVTRSRPWIILAGILAGFCASTKLHGAILMPLLTLQICFWGLKTGQRWKTSALSTALFFISGLCIALPWYLKTWAGTGNPVWPFLHSILGGRWGAPIVAANLSMRLGNPSWFAVSRMLLYGGPLFLLLPAVLAGCLVYARKVAFPPLLKFLCLPFMPYLLIVSHSGEAWRYCWPFYPALALTAGWAFVQINNKHIRYFRYMAAISLAFGFLWLGLRSTENNELFDVLGLRSQREPAAEPDSLYLDKSLEIYKFCQLINGTYPHGRVLLFREVRSYYLDVDYIQGSPVMQGVIQYQKIRKPSELFKILNTLRITHIWINETAWSLPPNQYSRHIASLMDDTLRSHAYPVLRDGTNVLYELRG